MGDGVLRRPGERRDPCAIIPGRDEVASPESITTTEVMDSGPAPKGASRNDGGDGSAFFAETTGRGLNLPSLFSDQR
jgi:hypothetical protein